MRPEHQVRGCPSAIQVRRHSPRVKKEDNSGSCASLGGLLLSPLADRFGRRRSLVVLLALFGVATFLSVFATNVTGFAVTRFLAGALGGALLPSAASLVADISSIKRRSAMVGVVYAGMGVGPLVAAGVVAGLLEHIGWQGVYVICALAPMRILGPILLLVQCAT